MALHLARSATHLYRTVAGRLVNSFPDPCPGLYRFAALRIGGTTLVRIGRTVLGGSPVVAYAAGGPPYYWPYAGVEANHDGIYYVGSVCSPGWASLRCDWNVAAVSEEGHLRFVLGWKEWGADCLQDGDHGPFYTRGEYFGGEVLCSRNGCRGYERTWTRGYYRSYDVAGTCRIINQRCYNSDRIVADDTLIEPYRPEVEFEGWDPAGWDDLPEAAVTTVSYCR